MPRRAFAVLVAVAALSAVLTAQSSVILDQQSPAEVPPAPVIFAVGGTSGQVISQTVTVGLAGGLRAVDVPIGCTDGELLIEIRDVDSLGQPGPTVLSDERFPASDFPVVVTDTFQRLRLRGMPDRFSVGDTFAISLSNPTGSCGIWPGPVGNPYAGGTGWADSNDGPITPLGNGTGREDLPFRTFVR